MLAASPTLDIAIWTAILILAVVALVGAVAWLRRRLHARAEPDAPPFTLHDLRTMHAAGRLSDAEFERAKDAMLAHTVGKRGGSSGDEPKAPANRPPPPTPPASG